MRTQFLLRTAAILVALSMITACMQMVPSGPGNPNTPYKIIVNFADANSCTITGITEDTTTCTPPHTGFCMGQNESVQWESNPAGIRYEVFFDPINGQPFKSNANGILRRTIDGDAPWVKYKYSILRENCDPKTDAYDPHIRVDR